jgi:hypothetical protein
MSDEATNEIDADLAKKYFGLDDECEAEIMRMQMENMSAQKEVRQKQKRDFKMGVAEGLPKAAFQLELKRHRLDAKHARQNENLLALEEPDVVELADVIREKLGAFSDSPLGQAAIGDAEAKVEKRRGRKSAALDDLAGDNDDYDPRPQFLKQAEADRIANNAVTTTTRAQAEADRIADNEELLRAGIRPLAD